MRILARLFVAGVIAFALLQLVRPGIPERPASAELQAPTAIKNILAKDCYSCHSDEKRLAWFDEIVPGYWLVRHDILEAREHLNFSTIGSLPAAAQKAALYEAVNMVQLGAMPLPQFTALHPDAKVTPEELAALKEYLGPWSAKLAQASGPGSPGKTSNAGNPAATSLTAVPAEFNGLPFESDFESWKPISTTDRGDNYTFRFILGNDTAVQAAASGKISPWPDGSRFAKIAWAQELGDDGLVHPGKFVQVEFMMKDAQRYKDTDGWGWGRWRGLDLKPYGNGAKFVKECTGCHLPVRGDDYVYTLPISAANVSGAKVERAEIVNQRAAALPASLPYQPLGWSAITMYVDPKNRTTATLYGNDVAMHAVNAREEAVAAPAYSAGAVLALVTWAQREDPHWFGARIPDVPVAVEFVQVTSAEKVTVMYKRFAGAGLVEDHVADGVASERGKFITGLRPARLP